MKKVLLSLFVLFVFSIFAFGLVSFVPNTTPTTKADGNFNIDGSYTVNVSGNSVVSLSPLTFVPVAIVGQVTITGNTASGSRILTIGGNPNPQLATFTCTVSPINPDGTGDLSCDVDEKATNLNIPIRRDTFRFAVADNGKVLDLLFLSGVPLVPGVPPISGAVISGTAKRQ
jgi:hypothetical protein